MDPNACLEMINRALDDDDLETARELYEDLTDWLHKGGYRPDGIDETWERLARA